MKGPCFAAVVLAAASMAATAQTPIYESKDKAGPVYSDKSSPGAVAAELPPPNVIQVPAIAPPAPPPPMAAAPAYRSLAIVSLANESTVHSNTGAFDFSARAVPALRASDRIRIRLDGRMLPASFRSTLLRVTESDWKGAVGTQRPDHSLQLAIVDAQGRVLIESLPVRFYVQRTTVKARAR
jgi:hypothetical protein